MELEESYRGSLYVLESEIFLVTSCLCTPGLGCRNGSLNWVPASGLLDKPPIGRLENGSMGRFGRASTGKFGKESTGRFGRASTGRFDNGWSGIFGKGLTGTLAANGLMMGLGEDLGSDANGLLLSS